MISERVDGFEPTNGSLGSYCLTTWLHPQEIPHIWWLNNPIPTHVVVILVGVSYQNHLGYCLLRIYQE